MIPTLLIAFAFTSKFLEFNLSKPSKVLAHSSAQLRTGEEASTEPDELAEEPVIVVSLGGMQGVATAAVVVFAAIILELVTLLALAFENYNVVIVWFDMLAIAALGLLIGLKAIEPLVQNAPLREGETRAMRQKFADQLVVRVFIAMAVITAGTAIFMALS